MGRRAEKNSPGPWPVEILPKGGGPNPLNPYDKLSSAERAAKVVEIMAGIYARVPQETKLENRRHAREADVPSLGPEPGETVS